MMHKMIKNRHILEILKMQPNNHKLLTPPLSAPFRAALKTLVPASFMGLGAAVCLGGWAGAGMVLAYETLGLLSKAAGVFVRANGSGGKKEPMLQPAVSSPKRYVDVDRLNVDFANLCQRMNMDRYIGNISVHDNPYVHAALGVSGAKSGFQILISKGAVNTLPYASVLAMALHEQGHINQIMQERILDAHVFGPRASVGLSAPRVISPSLIVGLGAAGVSTPALLAAGAGLVGLSYGLTALYNTRARRIELACDYTAVHAMGTAVPLIRVLKAMQREQAQHRKQHPVLSFLTTALPFCATHPPLTARRKALHVAHREIRQLAKVSGQVALTERLASGLQSGSLQSGPRYR